MRRRADPALKYRAYTPKISQQEELLAIRHGDFDPKQYDLKLLDAKSRFEEAAEHTRLPPACKRYGIAGYGIAYHPRIY